ncbi:MAG: pyrimidine dimer DNA glycosylase/endonuclease V [Candidatus Woesearchaeota archaeon]
MRLWTLHPKCLDHKGLVAVWREALLAKKVLQGKTKGYRHHPQLIRFRKTRHPIRAINSYLQAILKEAKARNYKFDETKAKKVKAQKITATTGQLSYEFGHLKKKLRKRSKIRLKANKIEPHPLFKIKKGKIENWEKYGRNTNAGRD